MSGAEVARLLFSGVCGRVTGGDTQDSAESAWQLTGFSLSLLRKICCRLSVHSLDGDGRVSWVDILGLLFEHMDLMPQLVSTGGVCLRSQRIPGIHSAALLMTVSCCSEYFVKKRTLLFLKRFLLQKLGDDWSLEGVLSTEQYFPGIKVVWLNDYSVLEAACASGCNPHCHFVLLLQSLSFDHSILLDFLISSETCFLEYFVRYLKYLRGDWQGFTAASGHRKVPLADSHGSELGEGLQPKSSVSPLEGSSLDVGLRLVEYDNSDESSEESPNGHKESKSPTALMTDSSSKMKTKHSSSMIQSEQGCPTEAAPLEQETCDTLEKTVSCLSELREVVTRLQTKKLFPYNPSSLLKLLAQVETCQRSSLSV
ncbi:hypothetical protein XENOCAPTIV_008560 [Xenoophorus captivus]|uniref:Lines homolog 1 n=1 Tax=Xenoophorus captivus TaxID=1517983 RepID=A0ABV0RR08_9TELE